MIRYNNFMSEYATKQDVQEIVDTAVGKAVDDLTDVMKTFMIQVDERFNKVERDIADLRNTLDRLLNSMDGFLARIDKYETDRLPVIASMKSC